MNFHNDGPFELDAEYPAEPEDYVATLLGVVQDVLKDGLEPHRQALEDARYAVAELYESQDPRDMGWVDDRGRP